MIFQRINRSDAETIFLIAYNVSGATMTAGYGVCWDDDTAGTADGVRVSQPATATFALFVGIASSDIVDSAYGLVQAYGYRASAFVTNDTSVAIVAGDLLIPVTATFRFARQAAGNGAVIGGGGHVMAGEAFATATTPAAVNQKVFIRAL